MRILLLLLLLLKRHRYLAEGAVLHRTHRFNCGFAGEELRRHSEAASDQQVRRERP